MPVFVARRGPEARGEDLGVTRSPGDAGELACSHHLRLPCQFFTATDDKLRCLPIHRNLGHFIGSSFSDSACTQSIEFAGLAAFDCRPALYARPQTKLSCERTRMGVFAAGPKITTHYRKGAGGQCEINTLTYDFYDRGMEIAPTSFAEGTMEDHGAGRIKSRYLRVGSSYRQIALWDSELARTCRFRRAADGSQRCFPKPELGIIYYTDAACQDAVVRLDCVPDQHPIYAGRWIAGTGACAEPHYVTHPSVATLSSPPAALYSKGSGGCVKKESVTAGTYVTLGATMAPDRFAKGIERLR